MPMLLWFRWFWTSRKKLLQKLFKNMFKTCYFIDIVTSVTPGQMTQTWLTQLLDFTTFQNRRNKSGHFMLWMTNMNCPDLFLLCWKVVKSSSWVSSCYGWQTWIFQICSSSVGWLWSQVVESAMFVSTCPGVTEVTIPVTYPTNKIAKKT
jgi:hypothetical protein